MATGETYSLALACFVWVRCSTYLNRVIIHNIPQKKSAKRQCSNTWQTHVNKEIGTSAEFCAQENGDLDKTASAGTKRNLKQSGLYCIFSIPEHKQDAAESTTQFKWS